MHICVHIYVYAYICVDEVLCLHVCIRACKNVGINEYMFWRWIYTQYGICRHPKPTSRLGTLVNRIYLAGHCHEKSRNDCFYSRVTFVAHQLRMILSEKCTHHPLKSNSLTGNSWTHKRQRKTTSGWWNTLTWKSCNMLSETYTT